MAIRINTEDNEIIVSDVATEETLRDLLKAVEAMNGAKAGGKANPEAKKTQDEIKKLGNLDRLEPYGFIQPNELNNYNLCVKTPNYFKYKNKYISKRYSRL